MITTRKLMEGVSYKFFDEILSRNDFTKFTDAYAAMRFVYEATWTKYRMKFFEEKVRADRANSIIIAKNIEMEKLLEQFKTLAKTHEEKTGERIDIPKTSVDPITFDT